MSTSTNGDQPTRRVISPQLLTPRDHLRAKQALAGVLAALGYQSTYDVLEDQEVGVPFTIWCLKSRTDPTFTWDQALDTPYLDEQEIGDSGPPPIPAPPTGGAGRGTGSSSRKPSGSEPERAAAPSSA